MRTYTFEEYWKYEDIKAAAGLICFILLFVELVSVPPAVFMIGRLIGVDPEYMLAPGIAIVLFQAFFTLYGGYVALARLIARRRGLVFEPEPTLNLKVTAQVKDGKLSVGIWNMGNVEAPITRIVVCTLRRDPELDLERPVPIKTQPLNIVLRPGEKTHIDLDVDRDAAFVDRVEIVVAEHETIAVPVTRDDC